MKKVKPPTNFDVIESLDFVWDCLNRYNPVFHRNEEVWDDICTAMSWIEDGCNVERIEGILEYKKDYTEHPADKDDRLYHEEQDHKAMGRGK